MTRFGPPLALLGVLVVATAAALLKAVFHLLEDR